MGVSSEHGTKQRVMMRQISLLKRCTFRDGANNFISQCVFFLFLSPFISTIETRRIVLLYYAHATARYSRSTFLSPVRNIRSTRSLFVWFVAPSFSFYPRGETVHSRLLAPSRDLPRRFSLSTFSFSRGRRCEKASCVSR